MDTKIPQTKSNFEVRGKLFAVGSESSFKEINTSTGKKMRIVNIGVRISPTEVMYVSVQGMEREFVYFSKKGETVKKVEFQKRDRATAELSKDGWRLIGVNLGLEKEEGKNVLVTKTEFDAFDYIKAHAKDGMDVFVKGTIEHTSYEDKKTKEIKRSTRFMVNAMYLTNEPIDFESEKFEKSAGFLQNMVVTGFNIDDGGFEKKSYVTGYAIGYNSIEPVSLEITPTLMGILKKEVRPYNAVALTGKLESSAPTEQVSSPAWGEESTIGKIKGSHKTSMVVTGARPETLDKETYNEKIVNAFIAEVEKAKSSKRDSSFATQEGGDWGEKSSVSGDDTSSAWE